MEHQSGVCRGSSRQPVKSSGPPMDPGKAREGYINAIVAGDPDRAEMWLGYIVEHANQFPEYQKNWSVWLENRRIEIDLLRRRAS